MNIMHGKLILFLVALMVTAGASSFLSWQSQQEKVQEMERQIHNLKVLAAETTATAFRDSLCISETSAMELKRAELQSLPEVKELVKDAAGTVKTVESVATAATVTSDTIVVDSMKAFDYKDDWVSLRIRDSTLVYQVRDSLTTIVSTDYRHHFLWWRWGKAGYRIQIICHNPNSKVKYNKYIKVMH